MFGRIRCVHWALMALLRWLSHFHLLLLTSEAFNLDASHPIVYEAPEDEGRSSYFGMSVAIRPKASSLNGTWSIQIGAPRGGAGGTAYRCGVRGPCRAVALDEGLAAVGGQGVREFREKKDAAWIGVATDIGRFGSHERSVVCGHRWMNQNLKNSENIDVTYLVTGVCYMEDLFDDASETRIQRLLPLVDKDKIYTPKPYVVDLSTYHWGLGQAGISAKFSEESVHLLIGAPGVTHWIGSVVRYEDFFATVANFARTDLARRSRYPYLGYSVAFGRFYRDGELWYVAGAPRSANYRGEVFIFRFKGASDDVSIRSNFAGTSFGEYFGSSVATADLNGDGLDDLVVGAPLFSNKDPDEGRIYVYSGAGKGDFLAPAQVVNGRVGLGRFGSCVASLGDLDQDGHSDVAVGAPYEDDGKGAIYVYRGFSKGLQTEHSQRIRARDVHPHLRGFGVSVSAVDVDGNKYVDIAVGSYLSSHVVLLRSRPVISLHPTIKTEKLGTIDRMATYFNLTVCSRYAGSNAPDYADIVRIIGVDPTHGRGKLDPKVSAYRKVIRLRASQIICEVHSVLLNTSRKNFSPLQITVRNELESCSGGKGRSLLIRGEETKEADDFPKDCPLGNKAEVSKEIAFAGICGADLTCRSDLELSCSIPHFRGGYYTLGEAEFLLLSMEVQNHGEPAYETRIKIWSNLKLSRRSPETGTAESLSGNRKSSGKTFWLEHEGILMENYKTNFSFQIEYEEALSDSGPIRLDLTVEIFTSSMETNLGNNVCKFSVQLVSDAFLNFYASSSVASAYVTEAALRDKTLNVTHYYEVQKTGATPVKDVEFTIRIPFYFQEEFLTFEVETAEWMHHSHLEEKSSFAEGGRSDLGEAIPGENCPPTNRTLFLNCSTPEVDCTTLRIFFAAGIPTGFSSYVKIQMAINVSALDWERTEKDIVYLSTTGVLEFWKYLEREPTELRRSASTSLYGDERASHVDTRVVALSILAGGFLLSLIVTGLARSNFFKRAKKRELKALKDADATFVYFAPGDNFRPAPSQPTPSC